MGQDVPIDERPFHAWLARRFPGPRRGWGPLGDDTASRAFGKGKRLHATSDALVQGVHFLPGASPDGVGRAAAAVNLSDLAAKGAEPLGLLIDLLVAPGTPRQWARHVVRAADLFGRRFGAPVVGGDTKPSECPAVVGVALGIGTAAHPVRRSGAKAGDLIVTSGTVGRGGLAAAALGRNPSDPRRASRALLEVRPRVAEGRRMARFADAMTDSSDGLGEAVRLIAAASGLRAEILEDRIPWAGRLGRQPPEQRRQTGMYGGDYELVAAVPPRSLVAALARPARGLARWSVVGRFQTGHGTVVRTAQGATIPLGAPGWRPFGPRGG